MERFEADKTNIKDLLTKKDIYYKIPLNQREYSWENEYIDNFWDYLTDEEDNYFLGTIVLNNEFLEDGYKEVVDGQQRLLTITIFLSILRDLLHELKEEQKSNTLHSTYIAYINDEGEDVGYKVVPGETLKDYFEKYIQNKKNNIEESESKTKEENRVKKNYIELKNKILNYIGEEKENRIEKIANLRERIKNLELVYIEVNNGEDAYIFFETINSTGMKLSTADVLKNLIFKNTSYSAEKVNKIWSNILSNLENKDDQFDITKFIRYFWMSKYKKVTDKKLYKEIKNTVERGVYSNYDDFIKDLEKNSALYGEILYPDENNFQGTKTPFYYFLKNLKNLGVIQPYPAVLSLYRLMKSEQFSAVNTKKFLDLINAIENISFLYKITGKSPSPLEGIFSQIAINYINNVSTKKELEDAITSSISIIKAKMPKKEEYIANAPEKLKYSKKSIDIIKYFFEKNLHFSGEISFTNISIEHIYPQNPEDGYKMDNNIVNSIGNLTIIGPKYNREASNKTPENKIEDLKKSEIEHTRNLGQYIQKQKKWNKDEIEKREKYLIEKSWEIFKID